MTLHAGYAASRISSRLKGSTKQFGWLQAPATNFSCSISYLEATALVASFEDAVSPNFLARTGHPLSKNGAPRRFVMRSLPLRSFLAYRMRRALRKR
jgi:hypothetical protein